MYAKTVDNQIAKTGSRPRWYSGHPDSGGQLLTDAALAGHGWLPVTGNPPEHDPTTHRAELNPQADWTITPTEVIQTYTLVALTQGEINERAKADAMEAERGALRATIIAGLPANSLPAIIARIDVIERLLGLKPLQAEA